MLKSLARFVVVFLTSITTHSFHHQKGTKHQHHQRRAKKKKALSLQAHRCKQALQKPNH